jgi:parallel beta-helix repeat protein
LLTLLAALVILPSNLSAAAIRVKPGGNDANDGSTWDLAKKTIAAALTAATTNDEVWVAAGIYAERITLKADVKLLGGFPEGSTGFRDWADNVTVIDGTQTGYVVYAPSGLTSTTEIDGFTIRNGAAYSGAGIHCYNSSPTITHNIITKNTADYGSGIYCYFGTPLIANNIIAGNTGASGGGGIYLYWNANATIINNTIAANSADGITCSTSSPTIENNIVAFCGAGIWKSPSDAPTLRNNCVYGNAAYDYQGFTVNPTGTDGNISVDPGLASVAYGNYHILPGSPCRNAGRDDLVQPVGDIDKQGRIEGTHVDIGADESYGEAQTTTPTIVRVSTDGNDSNDGSDWLQTKLTIQAAIDTVTQSGGEVWVKAGTYSERITLRQHVHLYGGFDGAETERSERDWRANLTIIDGGQNGSVVTVRAGHMISTIDGFTIRNGQTSQTGGGINCYYSSALVSNNTIIGNSATNGGGGIACLYSSSAILGNYIKGNSCTSPTYGGGGVYADHSYATIANNVILGNSAVSGGGAYLSSFNGRLVNNTIAGNTGEGAGIYFYYSSPTASNNIVTGNSSGVYRYISGTNPVLYNNCVWGNAAYDYSGFVSNPTGTNGNISVDPQLASVVYGDLHILPGSPCRNVGLDSAVQPGWLDMDGQARIEGIHVDIGADESYDEPRTVIPLVIRVSTDGNDGNDGSSWILAKLTVRAAIDSASAQGGEVWVRAGVYNERFVLPPCVYLYGGFDGGETSRSERDWTANLTILDGQQGGSVVSVQAGHRVSAVDGLVIRNASGLTGGINCLNASPTIANNVLAGNSSPGINCDRSSPIILNNAIKGNTGSGIYCSNSSPVIANNIIAANSNSASDGGGIYCTSSSPQIVNNTIVANSASSGGGIYISGSPSISNNIVAFNSSGIYKSTGTPTLRNNCVWENAAYDYSGFVSNPTGTNGNISVDPQLASVVYGDLHILPGSPCRNTGYNSAPGLPELDMDGEARIQETIVDMGADESDGSDPPTTHRMIYVDASKPADGDGTAWATAHQAIQTASDDVASAGGAEVWVAAGVYSEKVKLMPFGHLYGGFDGTETDRSQRDFGANVTTIDGGTSGNTVTGVNVSTIDGFTIRKGSAGVSCTRSSPTIANNRIVQFTQYGVYCSAASPSITNNTVTGDGNFYGIYCFGAGSPSIADNVITWNNYGIYCGTSTSAAVISNQIVGNSHGIYLSSSSSTVNDNTITGSSSEGIYCASSSATLTNNIVASNYDGIGCSFGSPVIINNTIAGNSRYGLSLSSSSAVASNNIIASNKVGIYKNAGTPVTSYNDVWDNATPYSGIDPGAGDIWADPLFADAALGYFHIQPGSPCRNVGTNSAPSLPTLDMDGQDRIQDTTVDIGADESDGTVPSSTPRIVYVNGGAAPGGDGASWSSAHQTIQAAADNIAANGGAEVWVAQGTYAENVIFFPFTYLYGGFAGTEADRGLRDWKSRITEVAGPGTSGTVAYGMGASAIDGFKVTGGNIGVYYFFGSPTIANNTVGPNSLSTGTGIMIAGSATPFIWNNKVSGRADGIYYMTNSSPIILSNVVVGNGRGIYTSSFVPSKVVNNTVVANTQSGIYTYYTSATLANNISVDNGIGINVVGGTPVLTHNNVYNNTTNNYSGIVADPSDISQPPLFAGPGDYHLTSGSACVNAGDDAEVLPGWLDMDGEARTQGTHVDIGADEYSLSLTPSSIKQAKDLADGDPVSIQGAIVAASFTDSFYIEADQRECGIRVDKAAHGLSDLGIRANVVGVMDTDDVTGERCIVASEAVENGTGSVDPLGLCNKLLGGGNYWYNESTGAGQKGVLGGFGLNNIGLLVKTWGSVTERHMGDSPAWFKISDGSLDGGVKVVLPPTVTLDPTWTYVGVIGASSCDTKDGSGNLIRLLRARKQSDLIQLQP